MFSQACVKNSVQGEGGSASVHAGIHLSSRLHPRQTSPSWADTPPGRRPPTGQTSPANGYCSGRYASYWNAFLFSFMFISTTLYNNTWKCIWYILVYLCWIFFSFYGWILRLMLFVMDIVLTKDQNSHNENVNHSFWKKNKSLKSFMKI